MNTIHVFRATAMNLFANLALMLAVIGYFSLASMAGKPTPGGDYGVGYAFALLFAYTAVAIGISIATAIVLWKGGFDWVTEKTTWRTSLVISGLIALLIFSFFAAMNNGGGAPWIMRILGKHTIVWALPPLLLAGFVLVNASLQNIVPAAVWQWALKGVVLISAVSCVLMVGEWLVNIPIEAAQHAEMRNADDARRQQEFLAQIEQNNPKTEMVLILVFTTKYHDKAVREAALAKIKSNPEWQQYLVSRLQTPWASEVFPFLADNDVEDRRLFAEPIKSGILMMAEKFEDSMESTHTFYDGQFYSETQAILQTIAKFQDLGVDYAPAIRKLRKTLDTPLKSYQQAANLKCIPVLDGWLKKNEKEK